MDADHPAPDLPPGRLHNQPPELWGEFDEAVVARVKAGSSVEKANDMVMKAVARAREAHPTDAALDEHLARRQVKRRAGKGPVQALVAHGRKAAIAAGAKFPDSEATRISYAIDLWWASDERGPADAIIEWVAARGGRNPLYDNRQKPAKLAGEAGARLLTHLLLRVDPLLDVEVPDALAGHEGSFAGFVELRNGRLRFYGLVKSLGNADAYAAAEAVLRQRGLLPDLSAEKIGSGDPTPPESPPEPEPEPTPEPAPDPTPAPHPMTARVRAVQADAAPRRAAPQKSMDLGCRYIYRPGGAAFEYAPLACNPYRGCGHKCRYCYVPLVTHQPRPEFDAGAVPRKEFLDRLRQDAEKYQAYGITEQVFLSFSSDPYNPVDTSLTRPSLDILAAHGLGFCTLSKGGLRSLADIDLFRPDRDAYAATLTSLDADFSRKWEAEAALPDERIEALRQAHERGIFTWVSLEPTLSPEHSLAVLEATHAFVDLYKVGKANYLGEYSKKIDWRDYTARMINLLKRLGKKHYVKKDLQKYLPDGYHNPLRVPQHH